MTSKKSKLIYEFTGVTTAQTIDIDPETVYEEGIEVEDPLNKESA